jgi:hypothetical protein
MGTSGAEVGIAMGVGRSLFVSDLTFTPKRFAFDPPFTSRWFYT